MTIAANHRDLIAPTAPLMRRFGPTGAFFALFTLAAIAFYRPTVTTMVDLWASSSAYHHGFLVAPTAVWLILRKGKSQQSRAWPPALVGVVSAAGLWVIGRAADANIIEELAFVSLLIAGAAALFGPTAIKRHAFALALLYFMVPFGETVLPALQWAAAGGVMALLDFSGIAASIEDHVIATSGGRFEIAEACAGLNFLLASFLIAAVFAHLALHSWRYRIAFVALALAAAIATNILRAFLVIAIDTVSGGAIPIAGDHLFFGWALYAAVVVALIAVGRRMADRELRQGGPAAISPLPRSGRGVGGEGLSTKDERADKPSPLSPLPPTGEWNQPQTAARKSQITALIAVAAVAMSSAYGRFVIDRAPPAETDWLARIDPRN